MEIIKLNTTPSTNTFLKEMSQQMILNDFTVVVTKRQESGRGQMNSKWVSEDGKNLTFSVFCVFQNLKVENSRYLNYAISLSVFDFLNEFKLPDLSVKWPNDILSENNKICGILVENSLQKNKIKSSVIGIGLNVNQENFPKKIGKVTSIKNILRQGFDLDELLNNILIKLKLNIDVLRSQEYAVLEERYLSILYKKGVPSMFADTKGLFMGKIIGVSKYGKLQVELEDESIKEFGIKEVKFV